MSRALRVNEIGHEEFTTIMKNGRNCHVLKENIRMMWS